MPWCASYVDTRAETTAGFRSNTAAEARAEIIYERLINLCDDRDVKDALGFLMTRMISHQKSFEKALHAIEANFPAGKLLGQPEFTNTYFDMSQGQGDVRGPWNQGEQRDFVEDREKQSTVDGGDGSARVKLSRKNTAIAKAVAVRTMSDEYYEIAAYGTDIALSNALGEKDVAALLAQTLEEEKQTDLKLTEVTQEVIMPAALAEEDEEAAGGKGGGRSSNRRKAG